MSPAPPAGKRARRKRRTRKSVLVAERVARTLITVGGIGTIVAVSLICVFLLWVVFPLFRGASVQERAGLAGIPGVSESGAGVLAAGVDEYGLLVWSAFADGTLEVHRLDTGERVERRRFLAGEGPSCYSFDPVDGSLALGFADGSARLGQVGFSTVFLTEEPAELGELGVGELAMFGRQLVVRTPERQLRASSVELDIAAPLELTAVGIELIDHSVLPTGPALAALSVGGELSLCRIRERENLLTGEVTVDVRKGELPYAPPADGEPPSFLGLSGAGDNVFLAWPSGQLRRFDARQLSAAVLAEQLDLVPEPGERLSAVGFLTGKTTLLAGDTRGRVSGWFTVKPEGASTPDGALLVRAQEVEVGAEVTALTPSARTRTFVVGTAAGTVDVFYMTSGRHMAASRVPGGAAVLALALAPREDALVAWTRAGPAAWELDPRHPEASVSSLFAKTWYEGYPEPQHVWQSSSGTDDFEPKLGLFPLIFGTIKATLYSMLFGAPLALMAAIYSSEFLDPRIRVGVKSTIEIMASLPSVVLGFLAALVIAPFVQGVLPAALAVFITVPGAWLLGAYLWQLLPRGAVLRMQGWQRFLAIFLMLVPGVLVALPVGALMERTFFAGDTEAWLDGRIGSGVGGWMIPLFPGALLATALVGGRLLGPWMRNLTAAWDRQRCALFDLMRFLAAVSLALCTAWLLALALTGMGFDPRGSFIDTYVQRNALVVGLVMGFAIIPIIYTIAEDALSSVPEHLRLASLGAGATPWQTAVRVIVPTAMSGLFSALMIGLGRAVGETMIVLMATGNTPVMDWNVFSGFRTLSANIAVELPEAVRNSTHYRTLFLAALCLFVMTFALNTVAEVIRQRFRKRAFQL